MQTHTLNHLPARRSLLRVLDDLRTRYRIATVARIERAAEADLARLGDDRLDDIGLTRATIHDAVHEAALASMDETRRVRAFSG